MESPVVTAAVTVVTLVGAAAVVHFSPQSWSSLKASGPWLTAAGAAVPPLVYVLATYRHSDNPAIWSAYGAGAAIFAGLTGFLIALFLPSTWRWWSYLMLGAAPWVAAAFIYAGSKLTDSKRSG